VTLAVAENEPLISAAATASERGPSRGELLLVSVPTLAALVLRLMMLTSPGHLTSDGVWYALLGRNLISGNIKDGLSTYWPPLYPLLIGIFSIVTRDAELAGRLVSVIAGALLVIPIYFLARRLYGKPTAFVAALLTVIYPFLLEYSTVVLTESLYTLLFTLAVLGALSAFSTGKNHQFFMTGLAIGACYLVRPEAFGFAGLILLMIAASVLLGKRANLKRASANAPIFLAGFLLLSLPYLLYLRAETGRWGLSEKLTAITQLGAANKDRWRGLIDGGQTTVADKMWAGSREQEPFSTESPATVDETPSSQSERSGSLLNLLRARGIKAGLLKEYRSLPELMTPPLMFLAALGFISGQWTRDRGQGEACLLAFVGSTLLCYAIAGVEDRYLIAVIPIFICWSSRGLVELDARLCEAEERLRETPGFLKRHPILSKSLLMVGLSLSLLPRVLIAANPESFDARDKQIAECIKDQSAPGALVMASSPHMAFFAGAKHLYIPSEQLDVVVDYARRRKVDVVVVEEDGIGLTPRLRPLLDDAQPPPGWRLICQDDTPNEKVRVFKLTPPL